MTKTEHCVEWGNVFIVGCRELSVISNNLTQIFCLSSYWSDSLFLLDLNTAGGNFDTRKIPGVMSSLPSGGCCICVLTCVHGHVYVWLCMYVHVCTYMCICVYGLLPVSRIPMTPSAIPGAGTLYVSMCTRMCILFQCLFVHVYMHMYYCRRTRKVFYSLEFESYSTQ